MQTSRAVAVGRGRVPPSCLFCCVFFEEHAARCVKNRDRAWDAEVVKQEQEDTTELEKAKASKKARGAEGKRKGEDKASS